jgi:tRNA (guanine-N7-)-methyltransferase
VEWEKKYPSIKNPKVEILDIGCAYAGLLCSISTVIPEKVILGVEIRKKAVDFSQQRILNLREENKGQYNNIWVENTNAMKYLPNYFFKGQLKKM